ncbi:hypothetical protein C4K29_5003 [Pseudomonas chlororaphis subsp. piscium]|uniref:Uncharacterized protein n=1 Tax=Pseudomonas chlororaphis subsp. aureofaciens TaxID=587851 RepID=A0AAD0ZL11_9PSED|nr:hypothetical protein C4K29_5003 [Pseudomonas chlororaphis subsp. piscium]AZE31567.1 hypothetical protein C4K07_4804 [Pseudomonas chlororaphis subsp. aureofaciens]AZE31568.1 hypothetical protein C4K07_4805 [Pseudomonas chlororaphis subsp. aureofaciens]
MSTSNRCCGPQHPSQDLDTCVDRLQVIRLKSLGQELGVDVDFQ